MDICRDNQICGGCVYQGVPYEEQLSNKSGEVKSLLDRKDIRYGELLPIEAALTDTDTGTRWSTPSATWRRTARRHWVCTRKSISCPS